MDILDASELRVAFEEQVRMDNHRKMMASKDVSDDCVECGVLISQERQNATGGTDMCVDCLNVIEIKNKQHRKGY